MEHFTILVLRAIHIVAGVFWVGAAVTIAVFIVPTVRALGPEGGRFMAHMVGPARFRFHVTLAGILTVVAGLLLLYVVPSGNLSQWTATPYGHTILGGAVLGILALLIGVLVNGPTASRAARLGQTIQQSGGPPTPDQAARMASLQARLRVAAIAVAVIQLIAVTAMAVARYI